MSDQQWSKRCELVAAGWVELHGHQPADWPFLESADGVTRVMILPNGVVEPTGGPTPIAHPVTA